MKFSEYRRLREEEEQKQNTGERAGSASPTTQNTTGGRKFTDIMKERDPQRYVRLETQTMQKKQDNVSDFIDRVNQHAGYTSMQTADAASYINRNKDTYNLDADDNAVRRRETYDTAKQQALDLMKEAWSNQDLETEQRQQALNVLLQSMANTQQADKANTAYADYMKQFDSKEAFEHTIEAEHKQEEIQAMSVDELKQKLEESTLELDKLQKDTISDNLGTSLGGMSASDIPGYSDRETRKAVLEQDVNTYKNMIFQKEQQEAMDSLSDDTKAAFEELYVLQTEGYNKDSSGVEWVLDNLTGISPTVQRAYEREAKENAIATLEFQGISKDEFDSLYEYYKFARDAENNESKVKEWNQEYEDAGTLKKMGMNAATIVNTPVRGVTSAQEFVNALHYKNAYSPLNTNSDNYEFTNYTDTVRNATSQDIQSGMGRFLYQTGMSMADMAALLPLSSVSGGASLALMGTNAGTTAAKNATLRGVSKEQALLTGLTAGAAEVAFEKLSLDHFWDIALKQGRAATTSAFVNVLAQAGIEGSEEVFTEIANHFTDNLINGGLSEWYQNVDRYYKQGMSMEEAKRQANIDYGVQLGEAFIGGALSGGVMGAGAVVSTARMGKQSEMDVADFQQVAESIDTDKSSYATQNDYDTAMRVQQLANTYSQNEHVTDFQKGLFEQATAELSKINYNEQIAPREQIRQLAATIKNETVARAFEADYKDGMPVDTYQRAFSLFYDAGYKEVPFEKAIQSADAFASVIDKPTLFAIHALGQNQAEAVSKIYASPEQQELVNTMAQALGIKVQYQDIPGANGMYKDGTIYIANKTINPSMVVMSHELTHHLKANVAEEYTAYENYVIDYFKEYHAKEYQALYENMAKEYGNDEALIREEIAANAAETFLTDAEAVNRFVHQNRTIAERIVDFLNDFITKLKKLYQGYTAKGTAGKMLAEDIEVYEKARDLWYEAVNATSAKNKSLATAIDEQASINTSETASGTASKDSVTSNRENNNTKFMKKQGIEDEIQQWFDTKSPEQRKKDGGFFEIGRTSDALKSIGLSDFKIYLGKSKVQRFLDDHPEMSLDIAKQIPDMLENPLVVMSSKTHSKTSLVIVGDVVVDGKSVLLPLLVKPEDGKVQNFYTVTSAYGKEKENLEHLLNNSTIYYIEPDKKRTDIWAKALRVQFPSASLKRGSIRSIPKSMRNNNEKFSFKGVNAAENDFTALNKAEEMEKSGEEAFKIFHETGWFRGADGKWRFEIDDSEAEVFRHGDAAYRNNENYQKWLKMWLDFDLGNPEFERLNEIYSNLREPQYLSDYLVHDTLYKNYPFLEWIKVNRVETESGVNGYANYSNREIGVDKFLFDEYSKEVLKRTLLHEIQHIIQAYEKFSRGASVNTWDGLNIVSDKGILLDDIAKYEMTAGEIEARDTADRIKLTEEERREKFPTITTEDGVIFAENKENPFKPKFSLKSYADNIGIRFSDKDGGDLFESIFMGTDNVDYQSVLYDDGTAEYKATMKMLQETAGILRDGITASKKLKHKNNISKEHAKSLSIHYLNKYRATYDADTLANNIYNIFSYIQSKETVNYEDMVRVMHDVCKPVLTTSQQIDEESKKQYENFRKVIDRYELKLNEEQKSVLSNIYPSYHSFVRANKFRYSFSEKGIYLDSIWTELVEASQYALSYSTPIAEQMLALHNYMTTLESAVTSPANDMNNSQLAYDMALNIFIDYFKQTGQNDKTMKNLRSQMQKKLAEYQRDIRKDYTERLKEYKEEAEVKTQDEVNRLQKQIKQLQRERDDAYYEANELAVKALDGDIEALEYKIGKISKRNAEKLAQLKVNGYNRTITQALSRQETEIKNHIKKNMFDLQNRLSKPKENKFISQGLVRATIDLCEAVNIDTGRSQRLAERLDEMSLLYARMKEDKDYALASEYDEQTQAAINRLREVFTGRNITMLNMNELKEVDDLITQLRFQIVNAGKLIGMEKSKEVYETAVKCMDEINAAKSFNPDSRVGRGLNRYNTSMLNPKRQFRRMSGYKEDSVLNQIYEDLNNGQQKQLQVLMETARIFDSVTQGEHNQKSISKLVGKEKKDWIDIGLNYKNMEPVMVPRAFRVSLAMHIQNKSNLDHIIYGGLTIPEPKAYQRGDYATAYATGKTVYFIPAEADTAEKRQQAYRDAVNKLKSVVAQMTPYEKAMVKCAEEFFHEYTGEKINETSMQLNGYKKARVHNYFPIRTDSNFRPTEIEGLVRNGTIENMGMLNSRVGARNPILLEDITKVIQRQSENVAKYYGLAIPIRNFNKIYNTTKIGYKDSTKSVIARKWGVSGQKYIEELLTDLQTKRGGQHTILDTLQGNFAQSVLSGNLSVAAQQIVAYPTAAATLGWEAIGEGIKYVPTRLDMEHIAKYTPLLWYRNQGTGTQEIGDVNKSKNLMSALASRATTALEHHGAEPLAKLTGGAEKVIDWNMDLLQRIDTKAVGSLWKASEIYVQKTKHMSVKNGEEAYYQEVAKVFNNCIDDTQANYTTMQRPDILRNPHKALKMILLFKTQPLQNFGIMYDAFGNLRAKAEAHKNSAQLDEKDRAKAEQEYAKAKREFGRAISSQLAAASLVFVMKLFANALTHRMDKYRDEEDDISGWKMVEELLNEVISSMAGSVIGGSEVYDLIHSAITGDTYYGIGVAIIDSMNDFNESLLKAIEEPSFENLRQVYFDSGILTGVPGENIYKVFKGLELWAEDIKNGEAWSFNAGHETKLSVQYSTMMNALVEGDTKRYEERYADTLEKLLMTKTEEEAKSAIVTGIKGKLKEAYTEAEITYADTISILETLGDKEPYFTVKKWDNTENKEYNKYSEMEAAVISGNNLDEEIQELLDNGVREENVTTNLVKAIKEAYVHGDISKDKAEQYLKTYKQDYTDDDVYWKLREWDKSSSYAEGEEYSKFDDLLNAVENGKFEAVVKEYVEHGSDAQSIKRQITEKYCPLYQEAYLNGNHKEVNAIKEILNKLRVNGKRLYGQDDYLRWNKQAKENSKSD